MKAMRETYGSKKGKKVFYASKNAGKIKGVDKKRKRLAKASERLFGR